MSKKLTAAVFLTLSLVMVSWLASAVAVEKADKDKEVQIHELKEKIQQLKHKIELEPNAEKAKALKDALKEHGQKLERLMAEFHKAQKPRGEFSEIEIAIRRAKAGLKELRHAAAALKEEGAGPEKLTELRKKMAKKEAELEVLAAHLEKRRAGVERKKAKARSKLVIFSLNHANAQNLGEVIEKFLTPSGIIAADSDSNSLVIRDLPAGLEAASAIIKALDVPKKRTAREQPRKRREPRERARREGVFFGKVLRAGAEALTIETRDTKEKITLYVPVRKKEDGTWTQLKELSLATAALEVGSTVKVQWRRGEEKLWIKGLAKIEKEALE